MGRELALVAAILNVLITIKKGNEKISQDIKDTCGDVAFAALPSDIWQQYAKVCHTDSARLAFDAISRFSMSTCMECPDMEGSMLDDLIEQLNLLVVTEKGAFN